MDIIIDIKGEQSLLNDDVNKPTSNNKNPAIKQLLEEYHNNLKETSEPKRVVPKKDADTEAFESIMKEFTWKDRRKLKKEERKALVADPAVVNKEDIQKTLAKSIVLDPNFEKLHSVPAYNVSDKRLKEQRKMERSKTKGDRWYNLPATEVTEEIKKDLEILQMRSVLDPKHFYKKNDMKVLPKYFQMGKVMDNPLDYYSARLTKKEAKKTLVDELLADAEFSRYNKKKYSEIMSERSKTHYKAWKQAKKLKKKK